MRTHAVDVGKSAVEFVSSPTIWDSFEASTTLPANLTVPKLQSQQWKLVYSPNTSQAATRMAQGITRMLNIMPIPIGISLPFTFVTSDKEAMYLSTFVRFSVDCEQDYLKTCVLIFVHFWRMALR